MTSPDPPNNPGAWGLNTSLDYAERRIGIKQKRPALSKVAALLDTAPRTRCRNNTGLFNISVNQGVAFSLTCGRWDCPAPSCGGLKKLAARELFTGGVEAAWERGEIVRFLTLTAPPDGMTLREVYAGWNRVKGVLKYRGLLRECAAVVELQQRGEPHLHLLATGEYIPQKELSRIVQGRPGCAGRFGGIADIRAHEHPVRGTGDKSAVGYMLKSVGSEMAGYVAKASPVERSRMRGVSPFTVTRLRPIRQTRGWYPGGLAEAGRQVRAEWSAGVEPIVADDWQLWRVDQTTGEPSPVNGPVSAPEVVTRSGLALVTDNGPALLQAA